MSELIRGLLLSAITCCRINDNTLAKVVVTRCRIVDNEMDTRTRILEAAEKLLDASPDRDVATREVCEAAGVGQPVLYRLFGDKDGMLRAVVDHGFDRYLATKRAARPSADPVKDLRTGWDTHVAFGLEHPALYRLMFSPRFDPVPDAAAEALGILRAVLVRCAQAGVLAADVDLAAQTIMSANVGVTLSLITQPKAYANRALSHTVRDAVHRALLADDVAVRAAPQPALATSANQVAALLDAAGDVPLTAAEVALMRQWLATLAGAER
jgi:AcrR family transcriptional regulator